MHFVWPKSSRTKVGDWNYRYIINSHGDSTPVTGTPSSPPLEKKLAVTGDWKKWGGGVGGGGKIPTLKKKKNFGPRNSYWRKSFYQKETGRKTLTWKINVGSLVSIFSKKNLCWITCFHANRFLLEIVGPHVPRHWCLKRKSNRTNRNIEILPKDSKNDHKCTQTL